MAAAKRTTKTTGEITKGHWRGGTRYLPISKTETQKAEPAEPAEGQDFTWSVSFCIPPKNPHKKREKESNGNWLDISLPHEYTHANPFSAVLVSLQFANDMHTSGRAKKAEKEKRVARKAHKDFQIFTGKSQSINCNQAE